MGKINAVEQDRGVIVRKERCHLRSQARSEDEPRDALLWLAEPALDVVVKTRQRRRAAVRLVGDGGRGLWTPKGGRDPSSPFRFLQSPPPRMPFCDLEPYPFYAEKHKIVFLRFGQGQTASRSPRHAGGSFGARGLQPPERVYILMTGRRDLAAFQRHPSRIK